jgi:hypothetical protein
MEAVCRIQNGSEGMVCVLAWRHFVLRWQSRAVPALISTKGYYEKELATQVREGLDRA